MTFEELDFKEILPHWMQEDDFDAALADAITTILASATSRYKTLRVWDQLENLTSTELDELAYELSIDWWDSSWDTQTKVNVIETAQQIMSKRGTKWAVEQLVISAYGIGEVTEWFDYEGSPYHFNIRTNAPSTEEGMATLLAMIDKVKPARSTLDEVIFSGDLRTHIYAGCAMRSVTNNVIIDSRHDESEFAQTLFTGTLTTSHTRNQIS
ncbi:MAG: phage tail protein I [Butyrivibrio sp.]|nr:phage tail protein I [Butyrivibrio sp.]